MSKSMKQAIVDQVARVLEPHDSAVVMTAGALTVEETEALRNKLRESDVRVLFLRNRLAAVAFKKVGFDGLEEVLEGSCALAYGGEGALPISKILVHEAKSNEKLKLLGGLMDGEVLDSEGIHQLSKMPGKKELQAMVLQGFFGPVSEFCSSMNNLLTEVHGLVEALEKKQGEG